MTNEAVLRFYDKYADDAFRLAYSYLESRPDDEYGARKWQISSPFRNQRVLPAFIRQITPLGYYHKSKTTAATPYALQPPYYNLFITWL
ncbi:MAG: hypothetical protein K5875_04605 [Saccharofermentans sp.]|nr:hypothetical protein [Saccharofermentans sp.]